MKKYFYLVLYAVLIGTVSLGVVSCKKDDPEPEIVTNPLDEEVYYLIGKVTEKNQALADVTVKASSSETKTAQDGTFELKVTSKGDYTLSFTKTGYVTVSSVATIESNAKKNSSVALTQQLVKTNPAVTVSPITRNTIVEANNPNLSVVFPVGAVKEPTPITVTEFTEGAKKTATGAVQASLATISFEPDGLTFEQPVTVYLKASTGGKARFSNLRHFVEKNGQWTDSGVATYDAEQDAYAFELMGFSNHSVRFTVTRNLGSVVLEPLSVVEVDNLGTMTSKEQEISTTQKFGWEVSGNLTSLLNTALPGLSSDEISAFASSITTSIASLKGSAAGVAESSLSLGAARVSGDTKLTVTLTTKVQETGFVFTVAHNGSDKQVSIPVKTYLGTDVAMAYTFGQSHGEHSGGGGL